MKFAFSNKLGIVSQSIAKVAAAPVKLPVEHIVAIDVSGSMSSALVDVRRHLKNKLVTLVGEDDTVSLVWFSGKHEFGVLQEGIKIRSLKDLSSVNNAIDKWLQPVGLTGFKQPLEAASELIDRLKAQRSASLVNFIFMTDGYDNQWQQKEILAAVDDLAAKADASTFVEYGWYCNRDLLAKMAEQAGGAVVFAEHFDSYQSSFEAEMTKNILGGKKVLVTLSDKATLGYAFSYDADGNILSYAVNDSNQVMVSESINKLVFFSDGANATQAEIELEESLVGLATLSQRMLANEIFDILAKTGDVKMINKFTNAFSKQDYSDFQDFCVDAALDTAFRYMDGCDFNAIPKEDAFTVIDLLNELSSDDENLLYPMDESFGYKRIGDGSEQKDDGIKFRTNEKNPGVACRNVVYNESRPNASLNVRFDGMVTLPKNDFGLSEIKSFIYRNYTIIRDGIVHTRILPVSLSQKTFDKLLGLGLGSLVGLEKPGVKFNMNIESLPVINRNMVKSVTAKETFRKVYDLEVLKAAQKVFKYYRDETSEKKSEGFAIVHGEEAAKWLKEVGVTDYNGFNPPSTSVKSGDVFMAKELNISVAKLSSLPKVEDVLAKISSGKALTLRESIMVPAIDQVNEFLDSDVFKTSPKPAELKKTWLDSAASDAISKVRSLNRDISRTKFAIIVGHVWFSDLPAGEGSLTFKADITKMDGPEITVTAELVEKES